MCHTECPDGDAELGSMSSPGERCPAVLAAVPAGKLAAGAAVTAPVRMRREGPRGREEVGLLGTVCWPCREPGLAGGQELVLGHWSAALALSLLGDSSNPLTRDTATLTDSGSLCSHKSAANALDKSPSKGGAHYLSNLTGTG